MRGNELVVLSFSKVALSNYFSSEMQSNSLASSGFTNQT